MRVSARTKRPSASVLPTSTVMPLRLFNISDGRYASPEMEFSTAGIRTRKFIGRFKHMIRWARPRTCAEPPISFFIFIIN